MKKLAQSLQSLPVMVSTAPQYDKKCVNFPQGLNFLRFTRESQGKITKKQGTHEKSRV